MDCLASRKFSQCDLLVIYPASEEVVRHPTHFAPSKFHTISIPLLLERVNEHGIETQPVCAAQKFEEIDNITF